MRELVDILRDEHRLDGNGYKSLLSSEDAEVNDYLHAQARQVADSVFGRGVYLRGLVELTNVCRNDCLYCGIRRSNRNVARYTLTAEQVMDSCREGYRLGFRTFVLQGGELPSERWPWVAELVQKIKSTWPDCALTLSLGEWPKEAYAAFRAAGADRYLLRHETHNAVHYAKLHPSEMSLAHRLQCLSWLKELGFQVGTGIMVGSPWQTFDHLVEDIEYIERLQPEMIGIGPFIPHHDTPLKEHRAGSAELTCRIYSILRLMFPQALIPSTTALNSITPNGRIMGLQAGANVLMPNLSPSAVRNQYSLYDGKKSTAAESAEGLALLDRELAAADFYIDWSRGDYKLRDNKYTKHKTTNL